MSLMILTLSVIRGRACISILIILSPLGPCSQPVYPPKFDPGFCTNIVRQWTYNPNAGQCVEFNYHSCGEDREDYDVFTTEQECIHTCVHQLQGILLLLKIN